MITGIDQCDFLVQQATRRARSLVGTGAIPAADWEDARQELLLDILRREAKFDSARGQWSGFVYGVMQHHAIVLVSRGKRREVVVHDLDVVEPLLFYDTTSTIELMVDVRRVVASLPLRLRRVAEQLGELSVSDICLTTGKSRSGIYKAVEQLRLAFTAAGIRHRRNGNEGNSYRY
jgi:RNA polymerase sigma-70 factor (ECF subfamily)